VTTHVALIREDATETIVLEGAISLQLTHNGRVTEYPVPDREHISDGFIRLPRLVTISAIVSPRAEIAGRAPGDAGVAEVCDQLERWQRDAAPISVQRPGRPLVQLMAIESWSERQDATDGLNVEITLKGVRLAQSASVSVVGPPRADMAGSQADPGNSGPGVLTDFSGDPAASELADRLPTRASVLATILGGAG